MDGPISNSSALSVVTFIVAPAMLTNAASVLAMTTINRMLRTRDRMAQLFARSREPDLSPQDAERLVAQTNRVEEQAAHMLNAMRAIYLALGSFAAATLVTLLGAVLEYFQAAFWFRTLIGLGLIFGVIGVLSLIIGSILLFRATRISLANIRDEAAQIRERQRERAAGKV